MSKKPTGDEEPKAPVIKDILSFPDAFLHTTAEVALFLGRTSRAIRNLVKRDLLVPSDKSCTMYFSTTEIRRYIEKAAMFKDGLGIPSLQKGHTPDGKPDSE